jgi:hypothetical protein
MGVPPLLLCWLLGHRFGHVELVLGMQMRRCVRCDKVETLMGARKRSRRR